MQLALDMTPRARRSDPETSHAAAARSHAFSESHAGRIHVALTQGPATAHELSERIGLTVVQIDRRLPELRRAGMARVVVEDGESLTRGGFRVWAVTR
jgi:predicted ArsR family transcriptional regulator